MATVRRSDLNGVTTIEVPVLNPALDLAPAMAVGLGSGVYLGGLLEKGALNNPKTTKKQYKLQDFTKARTVLAAIGTSAVVMAPLNALGYIALDVKPVNVLSNVVGGAVLGVGEALSGTGTETVFAQLGAGRREGILSLVGTVAGATTFGYVEPYIRQHLVQSRIATVTIHELLGVPYWLCVPVLAAACWWGCERLDKSRGAWHLDAIWHYKPTAAELSDAGRVSQAKMGAPRWSPYIVGWGIGLLQGPTFGLLKTFLGTSSALVFMGGKIASIFDKNLDTHSYFARYLVGHRAWWEMALHLGMFIGAYLSAEASGMREQNKKVIPSTRKKIMVLVGSFLVGFGARLASGCSTTHLISGVAELSVGSIATSVSMIAAGFTATYIHHQVKQLLRRITGQQKL